MSSTPVKTTCRGNLFYCIKRELYCNSVVVRDVPFQTIRSPPPRLSRLSRERGCFRWQWRAGRLVATTRAANAAASVDALFADRYPYVLIFIQAHTFLPFFGSTYIPSPVVSSYADRSPSFFPSSQLKPSLGGLRPVSRRNIFASLVARSLVAPPLLPSTPTTPSLCQFHEKSTPQIEQAGEREKGVRAAFSAAYYPPIHVG